MHTHKTKGTSGDIVRSVRYMSPSSPNRGVAQSHGVDRGSTDGEVTIGLERARERVAVGNVRRRDRATRERARACAGKTPEERIRAWVRASETR
jgi:hypothetical protein